MKQISVKVRNDCLNLCQQILSDKWISSKKYINLSYDGKGLLWESPTYSEYRGSINYDFLDKTDSHTIDTSLEKIRQQDLGFDIFYQESHPNKILSFYMHPNFTYREALTIEFLKVKKLITHIDNRWEVFYKSLFVFEGSENFHMDLNFIRVEFNYKNASKWLRSEAKLMTIKEDSVIKFPENKNFIYKNGRLDIKPNKQLPDGGTIKFNGPIERPLADVFINGFNKHKSFFKKEYIFEHIQEYYQKYNSTNSLVTWDQIQDGRKAISDKIKTEKLINHIILSYYDRTNGGYAFKIIT